MISAAKIIVNIKKANMLKILFHFAEQDIIF